MKRTRAFFLVVAVLISSASTTLLMADENIQISNKAGTHKEDVLAWRTARHERLMKSDGWLTLVGLEWINEGVSSVGSAGDNDIKLSGGPRHWGIVRLQGGELSFENLSPEHVKIDGEFAVQSGLVADTEGKPTVISNGSLSFHAIFRESYGLRIKDSKARALHNFTGVDNFPINEAWLIDGRFIRSEEGSTMEISNVLGQVSESPVLGTFEFDMEGKTHSLLGLGSEDSENLWFIFADRTSGHGTYGAGRFLYSNGMPANGRLTVNFNKAYNPPCAFNPWSTCPLPPQRNRMDLKVLAGEKDFHPDNH